ncbi:MAG: hypothetical protein J1G38_05230 [Clostridiales bacterium]|nr:hypothetical protein [Clostridiales bacterium]
MITTKRQMNTASDRFGGYASDSAAPEYGRPSDIVMNNSSTDNNILLTEKETATDIGAPVAAPAQPKREDALYSTRETMKTTELPKRPEKEKPALSREDIMPSLKTQRAAENMPAEEVTKISESAAIPMRRERSKLSPRTKVLLFVYVAIALVLAIAVIATGVSISNASEQVDTLKIKISRQTRELGESTAQLAEATNPDDIRAKAAELGMVEAGETAGDVTFVERTDYPTARPHTNGFDKFMDWLSKIFN